VPPLELTSPQVREVLANGTVDVLGRIPWSSNATLLVNVTADGLELPAIYKPRRGERPLWDFAIGTLCTREVAAFELSDALGWGLVPETVMREGPLGTGAVQRFVDHDPDEHYFTLLDEHADRFRAFATFDVLANNADRKSGHCLRERASGTIIGIDHGLTFHDEWKLRTVIWDFGGEPVPDALIGDLQAARATIQSRLEPLLAAREVDATLHRIDALLAGGALPLCDDGYGSFPWPLV